MTNRKKNRGKKKSAQRDALENEMHAHLAAAAKASDRWVGTRSASDRLATRNELLLAAAIIRRIDPTADQRASERYAVYLMTEHITDRDADRQRIYGEVMAHVLAA